MVKGGFVARVRKAIKDIIGDLEMSQVETVIVDTFIKEITTGFRKETKVDIEKIREEKTGSLVSLLKSKIQEGLGLDLVEEKVKEIICSIFDILVEGLNQERKIRLGRLGTFERLKDGTIIFCRTKGKK